MLKDLAPETAALVIVDIQERLLKIMDPKVTAQMVQHNQMLIRMFQEWSAPIFLTEQYPKGLGHTVSDLKDMLNVTAYEKTAFSACGSEAFCEDLAKSERANVILTGMETHICILQTALDLVHLGYQVYLPMDAVQSSSTLKWQAGLDLMRQAGVVIAPMESFVFAMLKEASGDAFRAFSKMLKEAHS